MSYLDRLKAKAAPNPFEGFAGAVKGHVSSALPAFAGFAGGEGKGVGGKCPSPPALPALSFLEQLQTRSESEVFRQKNPPAGADAISQTCPPEEPAKPAKAASGPFRPQSNVSRCHVCGGREEAGRWFVSVLTGRVDERHWLHAGECHDEHRRRCAEARKRG